MASLSPPVCDFGWPAIDFNLPATDGKTYTLESARGPQGLLVMFICNHCPYVKAIISRLVQDCTELKVHGINTIAIMSNDTDAYLEDSWDNMQRFAKQHEFTFPYAYDADQEVARAYGAVCTPDVFGFNSQLQLQYRGRFDSTGRNLSSPNTRRELYEAMLQIATTGNGPEIQTASIGCSIKWKETK